MAAAQTPTTAEELRGGRRVTAARVALLETVRDGDHLGVEAIASGDAIASAMFPCRPCMSAFMTHRGRAGRRLEPPDGLVRFEGRVGATPPRRVPVVRCRR